MIADQDDLIYKNNSMLCDKEPNKTTSPLNGNTVDDAELEVIFEGDVERDEEPEDDGDDVESVDEESEYDYDTSDDEEDGAHSNIQDTPFWFSYEDRDQICEIIDSYSKTLELDKERESCVRAPPPFVGRVKRVRVDNDLFTTLDKVSIYLRDVRPLGITLPFSRDAWLLTSWDVEEGIPLRSFIIKQDSLVDFWRSRSQGDYSYLYCRPIYHNKTAWQFEVSASDSPIVYASPHYSATHSFNLYLPKQVDHSSSLEDIPV